ncbi:MAG TPA: hypothetical protein VIS57_05585, partial [Xanthomonadales bacterium]
RKIGRNGATDGPQHEVASQKEKEITESQQETRPFTLLNINQIQKEPILAAGLTRGVRVSVKSMFLVFN